MVVVLQKPVQASEVAIDEGIPYVPAGQKVDTPFTQREPRTHAMQEACRILCPPLSIIYNSPLGEREKAVDVGILRVAFEPKPSPETQTSGEPNIGVTAFEYRAMRLIVQRGIATVLSATKSEPLASLDTPS